MVTRTLRNVSASLFLLSATLPAAPQQPPLALPAQLSIAESRADWVAAAEITRRLIDESPDHLDLLTRLSRYQLAGGDLERAADTLQRILALAGKASPQVLEIRGDLAKAENRPADALSDYQLALRGNPDSVPLLEKLALHHETAGEPDTAAIYYEELVTLRKERRDHLQLARNAVRRRDWNAMVGHLAVASELSYRQTRENASYKFESLLEKAVQLGRYDRAIKADPKDLARILDRAQLFHSCGFYQEALEDARRASRIDARAPHVRVSLAFYYAAAGDRKKGAEFNVNTRAFSGEADSGNLLSSLATHDRRVREKPGDITLLRARAEFLLNNDQAPLAMEDIDRALEIEPDSLGALLLRVRALNVVGHTAEARQLVRELAVSYPQDEAVEQQIGQIQMEDGLYEAAIATFDKILARQPSYESARDSRTLCYKRLQRQPPTASTGTEPQG